MKSTFLKNLKESFFAILPITVIVLLLGVTIAPLSVVFIFQFLFCAAIMIVGMAFFSLGSEVSMRTIGEQIGSSLSRSKKLWWILLATFVLGLIVTIAEPDLSVLAQLATSIEPWVFILTVSVGVGLFLLLYVLKVFCNIPVAVLYLISYGLIFVLAPFVPENFIPLAFDSGSATTGAVSVPFLLSIGIGIAAVRGGNKAQDDSFGLIAMSSAGPIIAVMLIGIILKPGDIATDVSTITEPGGIFQMLGGFFQAIPSYILEVITILSPIVIVFILFQIFALKLPRLKIIKISIGLIYTFIGITLFLTAVSFGFMPIGQLFGSMLANLSYNWILIPIGGIIGLVIILAEPAVHILTKQIEVITAGTIKKKVMIIAFCIGVCLSLIVCMLRALYPFDLVWVVLPLYAISIILAFIIPPIFTGIAFDSGGVASGSVAATFVLPLMIGVVSALGGNVSMHAFGTLGIVACFPVLTVQVVGLIYKIGLYRKEKAKKALIKKSRNASAIVEFNEENI